MTAHRFRYPLVRSRIAVVISVSRHGLVRPIALLLAAAQLVVAVPMVAAASPTRASQDAPAPTEPPVIANRTVPVVTPPPTVATLPETPTDAELSAAHIFAEPLIPMPRGTTPAENRSFAQALRLYAAGRRSEMVAPLLQFLSRYPQSAWRPS